MYVDWVGGRVANDRCLGGVNFASYFENGVGTFRTFFASITGKKRIKLCQHGAGFEYM